MARVGMVVGGIIMFILGGISYVYPVADNGMTVPQVNDLCSSGIGQLGQMFSGDVVKICREFSYLMYGIYGFGLIGIILIIVGAVSSGERKETEYHREIEEVEEDDDSLEILKKRYAKGEISKEEFEKMKKDLE